MIQQLGKEAKRLGVPRQPIIKVWAAELSYRKSFVDSVDRGLADAYGPNLPNRRAEEDVGSQKKWNSLYKKQITCIGKLLNDELTR